jgi:hypothetical protein
VEKGSFFSGVSPLYIGFRSSPRPEQVREFFSGPSSSGVLEGIFTGVVPLKLPLFRITEEAAGVTASCLL